MRRRKETFRDLDIIATATDPGRADGVLHAAAVGRRGGRARRHEGDGRLERGASLRPARRAAGVVRQPAAALHGLEGAQRRDARGRGAARALDLGVRRHERRDGRRVHDRGRGRAVRVPRLPADPAGAARELAASSRRRGAASCRCSSSWRSSAATCTRTRLVGRTGRTRSRRWSPPPLARGYEYYAITDHSHYLREGRLAAQLEEIERVRERFPKLRILAGVEANIRSNGEVDVRGGGARASRLGRRVGAPGAATTRPTERVLEAMDNPYVDCIGHLTGRRIGKRGPRDVDVERVIEKALETGCCARDQRPARPARPAATCTRARRRRPG